MRELHAVIADARRRLQPPRVIPTVLRYANSHTPTLLSAVHRLKVVSAANVPHLECLVAHRERTPHPPLPVLTTRLALTLSPLVEDVIALSRVVLALKAHRLHLHAIFSLFVFLHIGMAHFQLLCVVCLQTLQGFVVFTKTNLCLCIVPPTLPDRLALIIGARTISSCPTVLHRPRLCLKAEHVLSPLNVAPWLLH